MRRLVGIRRGALLHDIGKMGVPDGILLKPGKLTEEEWLIMKKHPSLAFEMLSPIRYLQSAIDIPYCHHEKWDGTGYPRGLNGDTDTARGTHLLRDRCMGCAHLRQAVSERLAERKSARILEVRIRHILRSGGGEDLPRARVCSNARAENKQKYGTRPRLPWEYP